VTSKADVGKAADVLKVSIFAVALAFKAPTSLASRLSWAAAELERLAGEAYRLADEAGDDPNSYEPLDPCREPIPGFPPLKE